MSGPAKVSVAVLCGGRSVRFGSDKAMHLIGGRPMYRHVWDKLSGVTDDIFLQVARAGERWDVESNEDIFMDRGPLGGIASALARARHERLFVVACDMPLLDPRMLGHLLSAGDADIVVPRWRDGRTEPTCALYSKRIATAVADVARAGPARISALFNLGLAVKYLQIEPLVESGSLDAECFRNVNSPDDLRGHV